jgi:hypothetical protein
MRTTKEVFENHLLLTIDWDQIDEIEKDYSPECTLLTSFGIFHGKEGLRKFAKILDEKIPDADFLFLNRLYSGEMAFLEWQAEASDAFVDDGAESFLIRDGLILCHTVHFTVRSRLS